MENGVFELQQELLELREKLAAAQDSFLEISRTLASHRAVIDKLVANETSAHKTVAELAGQRAHPMRLIDRVGFGQWHAV